MAYGYNGTYMPQSYPGAYPGYGQQMPGVQQTVMPPQPVQQIQPNMICRPVAGEEEARSVPTDFSGAITIMPDFAHGRIYTKMLNQNDGTSIFHVFQVQQPAPPVEYAPIAAVQAMAAEIEQLKQAIASAEKPAKQAKGSAEKQ